MSSRWRRLVPWTSRDDDLREEIRAHLAFATREGISRGLSPEEAEAAARRELGNELLVREVTRDVWGWRSLERLLDGLARELRHAVRTLLRHRAHSILTVTTMAVGIGGTTALFSVVYGVLRRPLPWPDAHRLVRLSETREGGTPRWPLIFSNHTYQAWSNEPATVERLGGWRTPGNAILTEAGDPSRLRHAQVTASIFELLGARPVVGSLFSEADESGDEVLVLSEGLWEDRFGRSPAVIGRTVRLDGEPYRVAGVVARGFAFPDRETRAWRPLHLPPAVEGTNASVLSALALLRPGVAPSMAAEEGTARAMAAPRGGPLELGFFGSEGEPRVTATPLLDSMTEEVRPALLLLLAAVGLLLLAATANVAGLRITAATARSRELALRSAVGAGRARLAGMLLAESLLLGLAGGVAGFGLAVAAVRVLPAVLPPDFPRVADITVDPQAAMIAFGLSIATGIGFGLLPASYAGRVRLVELLAEDSGGAIGAGRTGMARIRTAALAGQVAVASVLLLGGLQFGRSFFAQLEADRGYEPARLLVADITMPNGLYTPERRKTIVTNLLERVRTLPGVEQAAYANLHPLSTGETFGVLRLHPQREGDEETTIQASLRAASSGYFETLGRRLLAGRLIDDSDATVFPPPLVVSRTFAERYLGESPVGSSLGTLGDRPDYQVVGVVEDVRPALLREQQQPEVVGPMHLQEGLRLQWLSVLVRTREDPSSLAPVLRALLREQDPALVPDRIEPMSDLLGDSLARPRLYSVLVGLFATCALTIVGVGLFGALSYAVTLRRREIGLRMALGARPGDLARLVSRQALALAGLGLAIGLAASMAGGRLLEGLLYGVQPHDATSVASVILVLTSVAVLAAVVPARRAAQTDPMAVLRSG